MNTLYLVGKSPFFDRIVDGTEQLKSALHTVVTEATPNGCSDLANVIAGAWKSTQSELIAKTLESSTTQPLPVAEPVGYIMPYIYAVLEKIAEAWRGFVDFLSRHTPEGIKVACHQFFTACKECIFSIPPYFEALFTRIQELWVSIQPHLQTVVAFMQSNLGISLGLLTGGIICFNISQNVENRVISIAFFALGLGTIVVGGMFLMNTGLIPALPAGITFFSV